MITLDEDGLELFDAEEALQGAVRVVREIASDQVKRGSLHLNHRIEVADETGARVGTIAFRHAIEIDG